MRVSLKYALWLLAALPLTQGCDQKTSQTPQPQVLAPPIVDTPPPKPATVSTADLPPVVIGNTQPAPATTAQAPPPEPPKKTVRKPKKSAPPPAPAQAAAPAAPDTAKQETAKADTAPPSPSGAEPSSGVSAIGTLSGGAPGTLRYETEQTIADTEKGVNGITRTLSDSEAKTAAQIHEFLKQAREALTTGDVDGAHTLAQKAKVLLEELKQ